MQCIQFVDYCGFVLMLIPLSSRGGTMMKLTVTSYFHGSLARFDFFNADNRSQGRLTGCAHPRRHRGCSRPARSRPINGVSPGRRDGVSVYRRRPAVSQRRPVRRQHLVPEKRSRSHRPVQSSQLEVKLLTVDIEFDIYKKAELSQRQPRDAPNIWVPWKISRVLTRLRPRLLFPKFVTGFCSDRY